MCCRYFNLAVFDSSLAGKAGFLNKAKGAFDSFLVSVVVIIT